MKNVFKILSLGLLFGCTLPFGLQTVTQCTADNFDNINFDIYKGEILGLVGEFGGKSVVSLRDFSTPGYICLIAGAVCAAVVLMICAKGSDRSNEAAARRAARLGKAVEEPKAE